MNKQKLKEKIMEKLYHYYGEDLEEIFGDTVEKIMGNAIFDYVSDHNTNWGDVCCVQSLDVMLTIMKVLLSELKGE